ncbi:hypothetical protein D3C81_1900310 [compost metagenome]
MHEAGLDRWPHAQAGRVSDISRYWYAGHRISSHAKTDGMVPSGNWVLVNLLVALVNNTLDIDVLRGTKICGLK